MALKKIGPFGNLENFTFSRLFYYQALRIVEHAVLLTALVFLLDSSLFFCMVQLRARVIFVLNP
jgi:hypothetical protein